jgi:hypothetical protein
VATNPVDVLTHRLLAQTGFPASRVMGSGTVLDSSRLRQMLAGELRVDVRGVHAHIIGEHGDSELAVWSRANISGIPLADFCAGRGVTYDAAFRERIQSGVRRAAYEIIARKGSTAYAVGLALCRIVESIVRDEKSVLTVSTAVRGLYGLPDVSLSLPCVIGEDGIEMIADSPLAGDERRALEASAAVLLQPDARLGAPACAHAPRAARKWGRRGDFAPGLPRADGWRIGRARVSHHAHPPPRIEGQIAFIETLDALKQVSRRNLVMDGSRCENSAEHSWHTALMPWCWPNTPPDRWTCRAR